MNTQLSLFEQPEPKAIAPTPHRCHAIGCDRPVAPRFLMCPPHWRKVPHDLKQQVWLHYRAGQEVQKDPTPEYMAATAAIRSLQKAPKAVTLWQPWATLVALNLKRFETRPRTISWRNYQLSVRLFQRVKKD